MTSASAHAYLSPASSMQFHAGLGFLRFEVFLCTQREGQATLLIFGKQI